MTIEEYNGYKLVPMVKGPDAGTYLAIWAFARVAYRTAKTYLAMPNDKTLPPRIVIKIIPTDEYIGFGKHVWLYTPNRTPEIETDMLVSMRSEIADNVIKNVKKVMGDSCNVTDYSKEELIDNMTEKANEILANMTKDEYNKIMADV